MAPASSPGDGTRSLRPQPCCSQDVVSAQTFGSEAQTGGDLEMKEMRGAFLFSYAGNHPGAALLGRLCPHQQAAQTERQPGTLRDAVWGCVQKIRQKLAPPRALTHHNAVFLPPNALPQPLQMMPGPHAAPLSRLRGLSVSASPHHRCPHGFSCTPWGFGQSSALSRCSCCRRCSCHGAGAPPAPPSAPRGLIHSISPSCRRKGGWDPTILP